MPWLRLQVLWALSWCGLAWLQQSVCCLWWSWCLQDRISGEASTQFERHTCGDHCSRIWVAGPVDGEGRKEARSSAGIGQCCGCCLRRCRGNASCGYWYCSAAAVCWKWFASWRKWWASCCFWFNPAAAFWSSCSSQGSAASASAACCPCESSFAACCCRGSAACRCSIRATYASEKPSSSSWRTTSCCCRDGLTCCRDTCPNDIIQVRSTPATCWLGRDAHLRHLPWAHGAWRATDCFAMHACLSQGMCGRVASGCWDCGHGQVPFELPSECRNPPTRGWDQWNVCSSSSSWWWGTCQCQQWWLGDGTFRERRRGKALVLVPLLRLPMARLAQMSVVVLTEFWFVVGDQPTMLFNFDGCQLVQVDSRTLMIWRSRGGEWFDIWRLASCFHENWNIHSLLIFLQVSTLSVCQVAINVTHMFDRPAHCVSRFRFATAGLSHGVFD